MKAYILNDDGIWDGDFKIIDEHYQTLKNETLVAPPEGLLEPITFNFDDHTWSGVDQETFDAAHPAPVLPPTVGQQQQAQILLTVAKNKADQDKINAQLLLATATNQLGGE